MVESSNQQLATAAPGKKTSGGLFQFFTRFCGGRRALRPNSVPATPAFRVRNYSEATLQIRYRGDTAVLQALAPLDVEPVNADELQPGDVVLVTSGQWLPADGEIVEGCATIDQSALTGESAPVLTELGGWTHGYCGTRIVSGQVFLRITRCVG
jgi:hypothetical protein